MRTSSAVPGCQPAVGSERTLAGSDGTVINGTILQEDSCGYLVETPEGLMRVPHSYY